MKSILYLPLELAELIQEDMVKDPKRQDATLILWVLTQWYKDRLNPEMYNFFNERYLIPSAVSKEINARKKLENQSKRKKRDEIRRRENVRLKAFWTQKLDEAKRNGNGQLHMTAERHLEEINHEEKMLGEQA